MGEIVRTEVDAKHRYRIIRTENGYLVTARQRDHFGLLFAAEWLHRTPEAANACLDVVMAFHATWRAAQAGLPTQGLERRFDEANARHKQMCEELKDEPLNGQEVRALREAIGDDAE
jgi:hypothetical protein